MISGMERDSSAIRTGTLTRADSCTGKLMGRVCTVGRTEKYMMVSGIEV